MLEARHSSPRYDIDIELIGERSLGANKPSRQFANASWCIPYQPRLLAAIRNTRPDVLVGDGFFQWSLAALAYRIKRGTPFVLCYERTQHTERQAQWYRRGYRRLAARYVDAVCCNGQLSLEYTETIGIPKSRIATGFMAADSAKLQQDVDGVSPERIAALREQEKIRGLCLLYVGQLIPRKGVSQLLAAWKNFQLQQPDAATLLLVGDGDQRQELADFATRDELQSVRFVGSVKYDAIAEYYAASDALVMPTLEDNWSLVVPEAMACGLPILCSKFNGCWPELVHQGQNGWVFDPFDHQQLCRHLQEAVSRKDELPQMGQRSREIVADYTPETAARAIYHACQIAMEHRNATRRTGKRSASFARSK